MKDKPVQPAPLYQKIVEILEEARKTAYRSINRAMVHAYWRVGQQIVEHEQAGESRAEYGKAVLEELSQKLTAHFGKGFDPSNLRYMRLFYLRFSIRDAVRHKSLGADSLPEIREELSWTHYRLLLKVENDTARQWYLAEACKERWSTRQLERQIETLYFERLAQSPDKVPVKLEAVENLAQLTPSDFIKDPYVLEFLNLKGYPSLTETAVEKAILNNLQNFLLELGSGFAFIGRQVRLTLDGDHFYPDLVFYHVRLKCYVIIDLKVGKLTQGDIGQMQMYVNYYDREIRRKDDSPTVGLLLCMQKNDAMVKYILGDENRQIFASRYILELPSEDVLRKELQREHLLIQKLKQDQEME